MLKISNIEKTSYSFNGTHFNVTLTESGEPDWNSIGDGPTREAVLAWLADGNMPEPAFTEAQLAEMTISKLVSSIELAIQSLLDTTARTYEYDNINSIGKFVGYPNDDQVICEALGAWASSCWTISKQIREAVTAGDRAMPTAKEVLTEMPVFNPPNWLAR